MCIYLDQICDQLHSTVGPPENYPITHNFSCFMNMCVTPRDNESVLKFYSLHLHA